MDKMATLLVVALLALTAHADDKHKPPKLEPPPFGDATATADAAGGKSVSGSASQAASESGAEAAAEAASDAMSDARATNDGVSVGGTSFSSSDDFLALSLPGVPGAPAVGGHECMEHSPVVSILGSGKGGKTEINVDCLAFVQCVQVAQMYASLERPDLAVRQLATDACGGVEATERTFTTDECEERTAREREAGLLCGHDK